MSLAASARQYEIPAVSTNSIREAITKLSASLCDLVEQALTDDDAAELDHEFDLFCHDLRLVLVNRPDELCFPSDVSPGEEVDLDPLEQ